MNFYRCTLAALAALCVLCFISCSKEEEESTSDYLSGSMELSEFPSYVKAGEVYSFSPTGMYKSDETASTSTVGYFWKDPITSANDTLRVEGETVDVSFSYTIPDTLGSFTLTVGAFASGYYNSTYSLEFMVVSSDLSGEGSLGGLEFMSTYYEGMDYSRSITQRKYSRVIGSRTWMLRNEEATGRPFEGCEAMRDIFGGYATCDEALASRACPNGYHVSTESDWVNLAKTVNPEGTFEAGKDFSGVAGALMGDFTFDGAYMWEFYREVLKTNKTLFSAMPVGYATKSGNEYTQIGFSEYACFWSLNEGKAGIRYFDVRYPDVFWFEPEQDGSYLASIRCVK